jgi:hypothetical protein
LKEQGEFSSMIGFTVSKIREIVERDSFKRSDRRKTESDKNRKVEEVGNRSSKPDARRNSERARHVTFEVEEEKESEVKGDESSLRQIGYDSDSESDNDAGDETDRQPSSSDSGSARAFNNRGSGKGFNRKPFKPSLPLGVMNTNGERKVIIDFEKVKSKPCFFCQTPDHSVADCNKSPAEKKLILEKRIGCTKCLKDGHFSFECKIPREFEVWCQLCEKRGLWDLTCWNLLERKLAEELRKRKGEAVTQTSSVKMLKSSEIISDFNGDSCKYQGRENNQ